LIDTQSPADETPFADVHFAKRSLAIERSADGSLILKNLTPLASYPNQISDYLRHWAGTYPERIFLAEREPSGAWRSLTYGEAMAAANCVSQSLIDFNLSSDHPVMALGGNSIEMAILSLGTMQIGIPFAPVSPSYSLMSEDFGKLKYIFELIDPAILYVPEAAPFKNALAAILDENKTKRPILISNIDEPGFLAFSELTNRSPGSEVEQAYAQVNGDSIAKYLFTSGSTGMPKAVITTQRMLCANATGVCQQLPVLEDHPPVVVDWMPWHHVAAGNLTFNVILRSGGTYYIDKGRPTLKEFDVTIQNLKSVQPTFFQNVPLVYERLAPYLEEDDKFAQHFFGKIDFMLYASAPMPAPVQQRLDRISTKAVGKRIPFISSLGATETAPACILCHWPSKAPGNLGLPMPGVDIKLVPISGKMEMRVKGPNVTPGYFGNADATKAAFDADGYYCMGDAVKFVDADQPSEGLQFDGRLVENFKLATGTWVQTGEIRTAVITTLSPLAQDAAITGEGNAELGLLLFLNRVECARAFDLSDDVTFEKLAQNEDLRNTLKDKLSKFNAQQKGSSRSIARLMIMTDRPSVENNEITDKGYLNQQATLTARKVLVEQLYQENDGDPAVIVVPQK
jgi:feruloyl-CoA synthase